MINRPRRANAWTVTRGHYLRIFDAQAYPKSIDIFPSRRTNCSGYSNSSRVDFANVSKRQWRNSVRKFHSDPLKSSEFALLQNVQFRFNSHLPPPKVTKVQKTSEPYKRYYLTKRLPFFLRDHFFDILRWEKRRTQDCDTAGIRQEKPRRPPVRTILTIAIFVAGVGMIPVKE
jgi:hypothetical protein